MKLAFVVCPTPAIGCQYSLTGFMNYQLSNALFVLAVLHYLWNIVIQVSFFFVISFVLLIGLFLNQMSHQ